MKCKICGKDCSNLKSLSTHVTKSHDNNKEYYDLYLKKDTEGVCQKCGKQTSFIGFGKGYTKLCGKCEKDNDKSSNCKICGKFCKSLQSLHTHIRLHKILDKDYYDNYLKKDGDGTCKVCGKPTIFLGLRGYNKHCSQSCATLDKTTQEKIKKTSQLRYGTDSPNQSEQIKKKQEQSLKNNLGENFGKVRYSKATKTMQNKFGVANMFKIDKIQYKGVIISHTKEIDKKRLTTTKERYGGSGFQSPRTKETNLKRYGVENGGASQQAQAKIKETRNNNKQIDQRLDENNL